MRRKRYLKKYKTNSKKWYIRTEKRNKKEHGIVSLCCIEHNCCYNTRGRHENPEGEESYEELGNCLQLWKDLKTDQIGQCCSRIFKGSRDYIRRQFCQMFKVGDLIEVPVTLLDGRVFDGRERKRVRQVKILQILPYTCMVTDVLGKHSFTRSIGFNDLIGIELKRREKCIEEDGRL